MKAKAFAFILLAVLVALFVTPVYAQGIPALPHAFYGAVKINGSPAPVGTKVEARGQGVQTGVNNNPVVTAIEGKYGSPNPLEPKLIVQGNIAEGTILTFYVNGVQTAQTTAWHSGEVTQLDVTANIEAPPPGTTPPPKPAAFSLGSLVISPNEVATGGSVTISVNVANTGEQAGSYSLTLKVDGKVEASKAVTVAAASSQKVTFTTAKDLPGSHSVDINGISGTFVVKEAAPSAPPAPPAPTAPSPSAPPTPPEPTPPTPPAPPSANELINWPILFAVLGGVTVVGLIILVVATRRS